MASSSSLLDAVRTALDAEATRIELETGRGKFSKDKYDERVGLSKGLRRAIDVVMEAARAVNKEDEN